MEASQEQRPTAPAARAERRSVMETDLASAAEEREHTAKIRAFQEKERAEKDARAAESKAASEAKHAELIRSLGLETQANQPDPKVQLAEARKARAERRTQQPKTGFLRRLFGRS